MDTSQRLKELQRQGKLSAYSLNGAGEGNKIWLSWVGKASDEVRQFIQDNHVDEDNQAAMQKDYYFLGGVDDSCVRCLRDEIRPGSGLIRVSGGKSEGPGGTLTCLLTPRNDGENFYFAAAGHVVTDFWKDTKGRGSIYRYRKGFPPTGSTRFLGKLRYLPKHLPKPRKGPRRDDAAVLAVPQGNNSVDLDVAIVKLEAEAEAKQRTTCYGGIGENPHGVICDPKVNQHVFKCGSQEAHWTEAVVQCSAESGVTIYGPDQKIYYFRNQFILRDLSYHESRCAGSPKNPYGTPFGVPGDSGSLVVDLETRRPVGMLIAGSVLDGLYVMTPFSAIEEFFSEKGLVMARA